LEIHKLASKNAQNSEKFSFENSQETITIGRDSKCNIPFVGDKAFSKIQTTFIFDKENNCWKIKDGCLEKASTNGTW
jgi:FHA domain